MKNFKKNLKKFRSIFSITQEELSKKLSLDPFTISQYESGRTIPSFNILKKIIEFYQISFDLLLLDTKCSYIKNIRLLKLAKKLDEFSKSEARNNIEATTKTLLGNKINNSPKISQDSIKIELSNNFNHNLKCVRELRGITQAELSSSINISRSLLSQYEIKVFPPINKLIDISNKLNVSIHALATGEKLTFNFNDGYFGKTMLLADHLLPLEEHKTIILLMERIIKNTKSEPVLT